MGVIRLCTLGSEHFLKVPQVFHPIRLFSGKKTINKRKLV